jgi:hypothetical protein
MLADIAGHGFDEVVEFLALIGLETQMEIPIVRMLRH